MRPLNHRYRLEQERARDDHSPSPRVREAAARLRDGGHDAGRVADLTGVPAALVELMRDEAVAGARLPSTRPLVTAVVLGAGALGCSLGAVADGQPGVGRLGAVAAVLGLLMARRGRGHAHRPRRRR